MDTRHSESARTLLSTQSRLIREYLTRQLTRISRTVTLSMFLPSRQQTRLGAMTLLRKCGTSAHTGHNYGQSWSAQVELLRVFGESTLSEIIMTAGFML